MEFTLNKLAIDLPELSSLNIDDSINYLIKEQVKRQNAILEKAVRENAIPQIKGKLTKGKMRWRGLRMMQRGTGADGFTEIWIEQRGKIITPIIRNEYSWR